MPKPSIHQALKKIKLQIKNVMKNSYCGGGGKSHSLSYSVKMIKL